jgi:hypothetical protein
MTVLLAADSVENAGKVHKYASKLHIRHIDLMLAACYN